MENYADEPLFSQFCRAIQADNEPMTGADAEDIATDFCLDFAGAWEAQEEKDPIYAFNTLCKQYEFGEKCKEFASLSKSKNERDEFFNMLYSVGRHVAV